MSSYEAPEETDEGSTHDPGVKEKEITEGRESNHILADLDRSDYALIGILLSMPAAFLTMFLVLILFPDFHETAGEIVRWVGERIADILLAQLAIADAGGLFLAGCRKVVF